MTTVYEAALLERIESLETERDTLRRKLRAAESRATSDEPTGWQLISKEDRPIGFSCMKNVALSHVKSGGKAIPLYTAAQLGDGK